MSWLWLSKEGPGGMPIWAHMYLVTTLEVANDERLSQLKCVEQLNFEGDVLLNLIRIFDPKTVPEATRIKDFTSLDQHPELILYEGYMEKESGRVHIICRAAARQGNESTVT